MKKTLVFLVLILSVAPPAVAQKARLVKLPLLLKAIESKNGGVRVINFWATWCAPCVKELPLFEKLNKERKDVHVILVSMDLDLDPNPEKVEKFMARRKIESEVLLLDEQNPNSWINSIDKSWSGALPATLIISDNGNRKFVEHELHEGELETLITELQ